MKGNYNETLSLIPKKKSAPNYSESKYQLKQSASPSLKSSRLPPQTWGPKKKQQKKRDEDQQPLESPPDGSNMALMLIWPLFLAGACILTRLRRLWECAVVARRARRRRSGSRSVASRPCGRGGERRDGSKRKNCGSECRVARNRERLLARCFASTGHSSASSVQISAAVFGRKERKNTHNKHLPTANGRRSPPAGEALAAFPTRGPTRPRHAGWSQHGDSFFISKHRNVLWCIKHVRNTELGN